MLSALRRGVPSLLLGSKCSLLAANVETLAACSAALCRTNLSSSAALAQPQASASAGAAASASAAAPPAAFAAADEDEPADTLTLPTDLAALAALNPQLARIIEAHGEHAEAAAGGARARLSALLSAAAGGGPAPRVTKTALGRLRVDELRREVEALGGDARGNKPALVERLLAAAADDDARGVAAAAAADARPGVVSRRALARAARRGAAEAPPAASVAASLREAAEGAAAYCRAFADPHEVGRLLAAGRGGDVALIDVAGACAFADHMVLATGRSVAHMRALAGGVLAELRRRVAEVAPGVPPRIEGAGDAEPEWLVVDAGSVVVHVFSEAARREYDLESLWRAEGGGNVTRVAPAARGARAPLTLAELRVEDEGEDEDEARA